MKLTHIGGQHSCPTCSSSATSHPGLGQRSCSQSAYVSWQRSDLKRAATGNSKQWVSSRSKVTGARVSIGSGFCGALSILMLREEHGKESEWGQKRKRTGEQRGNGGPLATHITFCSAVLPPSVSVGIGRITHAKARMMLNAKVLTRVGFPRRSHWAQGVVDWTVELGKTVSR
jgi:hypothetical protein